MKGPNHSDPPPRRPNEEVRPREYLLPEEAKRLVEAAASIGRYGVRDAAMIELAYGHGLRVSELVNASWWSDGAKLDCTLINLKEQWAWIKRKKGSKSGQHDLRKCEIAALKRLVKKMNPDPKYVPTGSVFRSERDDGGPISASAFHKIVARAGKKARLPWPVHPHQLRHACGYKMVNGEGRTKEEREKTKIDILLVQEWLGHVNLRHTQEYAKIDQARLKGLWKD